MNKKNSIHRIRAISKDDQLSYKKRSKKAGRKKDCTEDTAWKWFSLFIRLRDVQYNGHGSCCTCGNPVHWKSGDAGHFVTRNKKSVKYDERNVHLQCKACNLYGKGEQAQHAIFIDVKYGKGTSQLLIDLGKVPSKMVDYNFKMISDKYRPKAKELAEKKGLEL